MPDDQYIRVYQGLKNLSAIIYKDPKKFALWKNLPKMFIAAKNYKVKYPQPTDPNALAAMLTGETVQVPQPSEHKQQPIQPMPAPPPANSASSMQSAQTGSKPASIAALREQLKSAAPVAARELFQQPQTRNFQHQDKEQIAAKLARPTSGSLPGEHEPYTRTPSEQVRQPRYQQPGTREEIDLVPSGEYREPLGYQHPKPNVRRRQRSESPSWDMRKQKLQRGNPPSSIDHPRGVAQRDRSRSRDRRSRADGQYGIGSNYDRWDPSKRQISDNARAQLGTPLQPAVPRRLVPDDPYSQVGPPIYPPERTPDQIRQQIDWQRVKVSEAEKADMNPPINSHPIPRICIAYNDTKRGCTPDKCRGQHRCWGCGERHPAYECNIQVRLPFDAPKEQEPVCIAWNIFGCNGMEMCPFRHVCLQCRQAHPLRHSKSCSWKYHKHVLAGKRAVRF
jgi:hypothetical protein